MPTLHAVSHACAIVHRGEIVLAMLAGYGISGFVSMIPSHRVTCESSMRETGRRRCEL